MRVVIFSILCACLGLLSVPTTCSPDSSHFCSVPPFVTVGQKPNVLIILDNSNSMDENFYGWAAGSYNSNSKSVVAKKALKAVINTYRSQLRVGLMGYKYSSPSLLYLYNTAYFASFKPKSYCPNPPSACVSYCRWNDSGNKTTCHDNCIAQNPQFDETYFDEIFTGMPYRAASNTTSRRYRYCSLLYPKTINSTLTNYPATSPPKEPYYSKGFYAHYNSNANRASHFCYASSYSSADSASNYYTCYTSKTGTVDNSTSGFSNNDWSYTSTPTDSDFALGFFNFGKRRAIADLAGQTWFTETILSPTSGFLYSAIGDLTSTSSSGNYTNLMKRLEPCEGNATCYTKSSTQSSSSIIPIVNAGLTPTAGTLTSAIQYLNGTTTGSTPIQSECQKTFIVYVTDGLPSVAYNGTTNYKNPDALMPQVLAKLSALRNLNATIGGTMVKNIDVKTYILGVGLSTEAKLKLDQMARYGGTNGSNNNHAFYADNSTQFENAISAIFSQVGAEVGSAGAVATVSQEINAGDVVVRGAFKAYNAADPNTYTWQGHLESYWPYHGCSDYTTNSTCKTMAGCTWANSNCTGTIYSFQITSNSDNSRFCSDSSYVGGNCTDAAAVLKTQGASPRTIFTSVNGTRKSFEIGNYASLNSLLDNTYDFNGTGSGSVTKGDTLALIKWVRGDNSSATSSRNREGWLLGDIVYSTPVVVGSPSYASAPRTLASAGCGDGTCSGTAAKSCFYCYQNTYLHRDQMTYVGANDGMLHGFTLGKYSNSTGDYIFDPSLNATLGAYLGKEKWAYIPSNLLSMLQNLAKPTYGTASGCSHNYMVDLSPQSWDVRLYNSTLMYPTWRTILLGGERDAGDVYFSLDVTNPSNGTLVYEHSVLKNFPGTSNTVFGNSTWINRNYNYLKTLALTRSLPVMARFGTGNSTQYAAISGGGVRDFRPDLVSLSTSNSTATLKRRTGWWYLYYPTFRAVALNGTDLWQSTWQGLLGQSAYRSYFKVDNATTTTYVKPWAVSNVAAYDVFGANKVAVSLGSTTDGFQDVAYAGDLNGTFYTLVLKGQNSTGPAPRCVMARKVKSIPSTAKANYYRGSRQPITVTPVAAYDTDGNLRVYFGTGKFDNVAGAVYDDKVDNATMTFYCMVENLNSTSVVCSGNSTIVSTPIPVYTKCTASSDTHYWVKNSTTPSGDSCFKCSLDLTTAGERLTDSALVAAGYVFFTAFVPDPDVCSPSGNSSLYVVDYECGPLANSSVIGGANAHLNVGSTSWSSGGAGTSAVAALKVALGRGMASRPVLDSSGTNLLIQTSENKLIRISVDLTDAKRSTIRGWTTGPYNTSTTSP